PTSDGDQIVIVVSDPLITPVQADLLRLKENETRGRVVRGAIQTPSVDLYVNDTTKPVVTNLRYGQASETDQNADGSFGHTFKKTGTTTTVLSEKAWRSTPGRSIR